MEGSKLFELLRTFSKKELRELEEWTRSPFFNKSEEVQRLAAYLRKVGPHFPAKKVQKEVVFEAVYGDADFNEKQWNYCLNFLLKQAERYLAYSEFQQEIALDEYYRLDAFLKRGLDKHFNFTYDQARKKIAKAPFRNSQFYFNQYLLADIANKQFLQQKIRKKDYRLQEASDFLDQFYLSTKLKYNCSMLDRKQSLAADYQITLAEEIDGFLTENPEREVPAITMYHVIFRTLTHPDEEAHYEKLRVLIQEQRKLYPIDEFKEIFNLVLNHTIRRFNRGHRKYAEDLFLLFNLGIQEGLLFTGTHLSPWAFKNVIKTALGLQKLDWVAEFIEAYTSKLPPEFREDAYHYNYAELHYYRQQYAEAQEHLMHVQFSDIYYSLGTRKLYAKIYFELEEDEVLHSMIASFKVFLKRNKLISNPLRKAYTSFIQILNELLKRDPKRAAAIQAHIEETKSLPDRSWLALQAENL